MLSTVPEADNSDSCNDSTAEIVRGEKDGKMLHSVEETEDEQAGSSVVFLFVLFF